MQSLLGRDGLTLQRRLFQKEKLSALFGKLIFLFGAFFLNESSLCWQLGQPDLASIVCRLIGGLELLSDILFLLIGDLP